MEAVFGGFGIFVVLFLIVLAIAWIIMPFAIIGTKPILRELLQEQRRTNELLAAFERRQAPTPVAPAQTGKLVAGPAPSPLTSGPRGSCPNCDTINSMSATKCSGCGAEFKAPGGWRLRPV